VRRASGPRHTSVYSTQPPSARPTYTPVTPVVFHFIPPPTSASPPTPTTTTTTTHLSIDMSGRGKGGKVLEHVA
jgi:hypothetical protein